MYIFYTALWMYLSEIRTSCSYAYIIEVVIGNAICKNGSCVASLAHFLALPQNMLSIKIMAEQPFWLMPCWEIYRQDIVLSWQIFLVPVSTLT